MQFGLKARTRWTSVVRGSGLMVTLALSSWSVAATAADAHSHVAIVSDTTLDWNALIGETMSAHPRGRELEARAAEAVAWTLRGRQWLAAAPALYFSYLSDRALDAFGQREYEGGIELPLWRGGQRSAVRALADSASAASGAATAALRLEVAGRLRGALWDIEAAANDLAAARDAIVVAEELVRVVERRNARGDLPLADVLLARASSLERRQIAVAAEARLVDAERAYWTLTGLGRRPAAFAEQRSARTEIGAEHPLVALADAEVVRAQRQADVASGDARGNIALTIGPRRQHDPFGVVPTDSLTLAVRVPVGGDDHADAARSSAARLVATAAAERGELLRRLGADLHEAEHTLEVLEESAALAGERAAITARQASMAETAFAQGEIELRELLRIQEAEQSALREMQRLDIEQQRTIAALNQALGELP